jgi:hypothetical protein
MVEADPTESSERELAVGLTFLVGQPIATVLDSFRSAVDMKADRQLRSASAIHGTADDFAALDLPSDEAKRYLKAGPGDALNLSQAEIDAFHALASAGGDLKANVERHKSLLLTDIGRTGQRHQRHRPHERAADCESRLTNYRRPPWRRRHS